MRPVSGNQCSHHVLVTSLALFGLAWPVAGAAQARLCENMRDVVESVQYPHEAVAGGIEGKVVAEFTIGADGSPGDIRIVSPADAVFDRPAVEAVRRLRCDQSRAGTRVTLPFTFSLSSDQTPKNANLPSLDGRPFRVPQSGDELVYRRELTGASGKGQMSLARVRASRGSESYPIVFSETDGRLAPPGTTSVWRFGLRLPPGACVPDLLGNTWLKDQEACNSLPIGERWTTDSTLGAGACESLSDDTADVPAGQFATRRIVCEWTAKGDSAKRTTEYWYSTQAGYMVQVVRKTMDPGGTLQNMTIERLEQIVLK